MEQVFKNEVKRHKYKVAHPQEFYPDWDSTPGNIRRSRIRHWEKEMRKFKDSIREQE